MKIANPIYDAAFKFLMEDTEIAKDLIGEIIGEEIIELELKPQEFTFQVKAALLITAYRIDFKAIIKTKEGLKKVLIELQKSKQPTDILRFRRYLGRNYYQREEVKMENGQTEKLDLPIISIYFIGFTLSNILTPVLKIKRLYEDMITEERILEQNDFVEKLSHNAYFIQIPRLVREERNRIEGILKVFNQSYKLKKNGRIMTFSKKEIKKYPLLQKMVERLHVAVADEEVVRAMEMQEEIEDNIELVTEQLRKEKEAAEEQRKAERLISIGKLISLGVTDEEIADLYKVEVKEISEIRSELK